MKGATYAQLINPPTDENGAPYFALTTTTRGVINLILGASNTVPIPVVTEAGGATGKTLDVEIIPSLAPSASRLPNLVGSSTGWAVGDPRLRMGPSALEEDLSRQPAQHDQPDIHLLRPS